MLNEQKRLQARGNWEDLKPVHRCAVYAGINTLMSIPMTDNELVQFLDNFEINNGLKARLWLEVKFEEFAINKFS